MDFKQLQFRAMQIRTKYAVLEKKRNGKTWTNEEIMEGFVVDVGELMQLVMAKKGIREEEDIDKKLAHELSDCLWSVLVLANQYDINLEKSFMHTMDEIEKKIEEGSKQTLHP